MLVLTRKPEQSIQIRENIVVRVLKIRGGRVRLGVEAPAAVPVHLAEVSAAISAAPVFPAAANADGAM